MFSDLQEYLISPCCKSDLKLERKAWSIHLKDRIDIDTGLMTCCSCSKEYPIIDGIPRLCKNLEDTELEGLRSIKRIKSLIVTNMTNWGADKEVDYNLIREKVREKFNLDNMEDGYIKRKLEKNIEYRVKGCEQQEKYVRTINQFIDINPEVILDIGGGQGGLIKCLTDYYQPRLSIMLDYDISWVEVARIRNPEVQIIRCDARELCFKPNSIDWIISQAALEHIPDTDKTVQEISTATKDMLFLSWNPNRNFIYDFGHVDAPVTIFPKPIAKKIAYFWHNIRRTGRPKDTIDSELDSTYYIASGKVKRLLEPYGKVNNVFVDFALQSLKSSYSIRMSGLKKFLKKNNSFAKVLFRLMCFLRVEPQCYYLLRKSSK